MYTKDKIPLLLHRSALTCLDQHPSFLCEDDRLAAAGWTSLADTMVCAQSVIIPSGSENQKLGAEPLRTWCHYCTHLHVTEGTRSLS